MPQHSHREQQKELSMELTSARAPFLTKGRAVFCYGEVVEYSLFKKKETCIPLVRT